MLSKDNSSFFKEISKIAALFGSTQFIQIIAALIQGKIIALLIGVDGFGLFGLITSAILLIQSIFIFGIPFSLTRELSAKNSKNNIKIISTSFYIILISSILSVLFCIVFASTLTNSLEHTTLLTYSSFSLVFLNINTFLLSVFQGLRYKKKYAFSQIFQSSANIISPLIFLAYFKTDGIPFVILFVPLLTSAFNLFQLNKIGILSNMISLKNLCRLNEIKDFIKFAASQMMTASLGQFAKFLIISTLASISIFESGLYQAGMRVTQQYIGLLFIAISIDFFPKITGLLNNNKLKEAKSYLSSQIDFILILATPMLISLILFNNLIINLIYSNDFILASELIKFSAVGMYFMAIKQPFDLIPYALSDKKTFLTVTIIGTLSLLLSTILGYNYDGLRGIGFFFIIHSFLSLVLILIICKKKYNLNLSNNNQALVFKGLFAILISLYIVYLDNYLLSSIYFILISIYYLLKFLKLYKNG